MKNITFRMNENLIQNARMKARSEKKSLNDLVSDYLTHYTGMEKNFNYRKIIEHCRYVKAGRKFSREEMNER